MKKNQYYSVAELAKILGISRIAVFKKIKNNQIKAIKIGRNFAIPQKAVAAILGETLTLQQKRTIDRAVKKTIAEYGETLKLLGDA